MIIICSTCGEKFDTELFPVCPYCLTPISDIQAIVHTDTVLEADDVTSDKNISSYDSESMPDNAEKETTDLSVSVWTTNTETNKKEKRGDSEQVQYSTGEEEEKNRLLISEINLSDIEGLSGRTRNVLFREGVFTIADLLQFIEKTEVDNLHNVGSKTIREIRGLISGFYSSSLKLVSAISFYVLLWRQISGSKAVKVSGCPSG